MSEQIPQYSRWKAVWRLFPGFKIEGTVDALDARDAAHQARNLVTLQHPQWSDLPLPIVHRVGDKEGGC